MIVGLFVGWLVAVFDLDLAVAVVAVVARLADVAVAVAVVAIHS